MTRSSGGSVEGKGRSSGRARGVVNVMGSGKGEGFRGCTGA